MINELFQEGINTGHCPYWVLYCIHNNIGFGSRSACTCISFTTWIRSRHQEYEPNTHHRYDEDYATRFTEWLKVWVKKHQTKAEVKV